MTRLTPEQKAQRDWERSMGTLSREVMRMRERQVALGAHASITSFTADMAILDTCFEPMQEKFTELDETGLFDFNLYMYCV